MDTDMGREPLVAAEAGDVATIQTLHCRMERELFIAAEAGNVATIQRLHELNRDILNVVTFRGDTALHIAAREGHLELVKWILQLNPSLAKEKNKDHNTPLYEAAKSGNTELVRLLLQLKERSHYRCKKFRDRYNKFGETALVIASQYGHVDAVKLLLEARSSEDVVEWDQSLRAAAYRGYKDVVVAMLDKKPSQDLNFPLLLRCLKPWYRGFREPQILHAAVQGGNLEIVVAMLDHPCWKDSLMTVKDEYGRCAVHLAAMKGHSHIINEFMLRMPDSVNIRSSDHKSVLHFAVEYDQFDVVKCLVANKKPRKLAELVSRDHDGSRNTALHFAAINGASPEV